MAKPRKGVIPPHLKKYLFKKGAARPAARNSKKARRRVKTAARRTVFKKRAVRRTRKVNPSLASKSYVKLVAQKGRGPRMHYDGRKFTTNGRALPFTNEGAAQHTAQMMVETYPVLRGYRFFAEPLYAGRSPKH